MLNQPFTALEKSELSQLEISLTTLSKRYSLAKKRAISREVGILPTYDFYREFIKQLKALSKEKDISPKELLPLVDIHSIKGYKKFKVMLRSEHKVLHSSLAKIKAEEILNKGFLLCRHCLIEKPLNKMIKSSKTLSGYVSTCRICDKRLRAENKALREVA